MQQFDQKAACAAIQCGNGFNYVHHVEGIVGMRRSSVSRSVIILLLPFERGEESNL